MNKKQPTTEQILSALNEIIQESKKTKLKTDKVELNDVKRLAALGKLADDYRTFILGNIKSLQTLSKAVSDAKKESEELEKNIELSKQVDKDIQKIKKEIENGAKELGINVNDIPDYSDADEKQARLRGELDQAERTLSGISTVIKF